jgi:hypothetical protein
MDRGSIGSTVAPVEALSALSRRRASGDLAPRDFFAIRARLHKDRGYWESVEVGEQVLRQAEELVQKADVRTLDDLHISSAVVFQDASGMTIPFITAMPNSATQLNPRV